MIDDVEAGERLQNSKQFRLMGIGEVTLLNHTIPTFQLMPRLKIILWAVSSSWPNCQNKRYDANIRGEFASAL